MIEAFDLGVALSSGTDSDEDTFAGAAARLTALDSSLLKLQSNLSGLAGEVSSWNIGDIDRQVNLLIGASVRAERSGRSEAFVLGVDAASQPDNAMLPASTVAAGEADIADGAVQDAGYRASAVSAGPAVGQTTDGVRDAVRAYRSWPDDAAITANLSYGGRLPQPDIDGGTFQSAFDTDEIADLIGAASRAFSAIAMGVRPPSGEATLPFGLSGREIERQAATEGEEVRQGWAQTYHPLRDAQGSFSDLGSQMSADVAAGLPALGYVVERPADLDFASAQGRGLRFGGETSVFDQSRLIAPINDFVAGHVVPAPVASSERNELTRPVRLEGGAPAGGEPGGGSDSDRATTKPFDAQPDSGRGEVLPLVVHTNVQLDGDVIARAVGERLVAWMNGPIGGSGAFDPRRSYMPIES